MKKLLFVFVVLSFAVGQEVYFNNFSSGQLEDWTTSVGEGDPYGSVTITNEALRLQSWNNCGQDYDQYSIAKLDLPLSDDYSITFRANKETWCGHFQFYILQEGNPGYYRLWWNGSNLTGLVKKNINGTTTTLANNSYNNGTNNWKTYRFIKEGNHLQFLVGTNENNLSIIYDVTDPGEPLNGGNVRFSVTQAGQTTWIDDIEIDYIDLTASQIEVEIDTLTFEIEEDQIISDTINLPIKNLGDATLLVDVENTLYWLHSDNNISLIAGDSTFISVWTSGINMEDGNYWGNLLINTNDPENAEIEFPVNLIINPGPDPQISISTDSLYFDYIDNSGENSQAITITNTGDDTLIFNLNSGERGTALEFDGVDDWVDFSNNFAFNQSNYTIELWFKSDSLIMQDIIAFTTLSDDLHGILIEPRSDKIRFLHRSPPGSSWTESNVYSSVNYNNGNWNHVACVKDPDEIRIYYNGVKFDNIQNTSYFEENLYLTIGKLSPSKDERFFKGSLDNVIISGYTKYDMDFIPSNTVVDNYISKWDFNEGEGNTLYDQSGNGNDGTINGATWVESPFLNTVEWLSVDDSTYILPPGESSEINVNVNGDGMDWGSYEGFIQIMSNAPLNQIVDIPVTMNVLGPEISVDADSINFEIIANEDSLSSQIITIENTGFDTLQINLSKDNYTIEFDENDDVIKINDYNLNLLNSITVDAWIYPTEFYTYNRFITTGSSCFVLRLNTGRPQFYINIGGNLYHALSSIPIPLNEWNHITGIWNGEIGEDNSLKLLVNGIEVNSYATQHTIEGVMNNSNINNFYIGDIGGESFIGKIDEPRIWNRVLSEIEIQERMYKSLNSNEETGLIGYWSFNEGNGNYAYDKSEISNHGEFLNSPSWIINDFNYQYDWITLSETTLSIPPGESENIEITTNASGFEFGEYEANITITSNDPENPSIEIPVSMNIIPAVYGCMYQNACNYNPDANVEDDSCIYSDENYDCDGICFEDTDNDLICNSLDQYPNCYDDGENNPYDCLGVCNGETECDNISLSYGNNLISFSGIPAIDSTALLLETIEELDVEVNFIIGQGQGLFKTEDGWAGNLTTIDEYSGYWLNIEGSIDWTIPLDSSYSDICTNYNLQYGNNLVSYLGNDNANTIISLGGNMLANNYGFIIGQSVGLFNTSGQWSGNLNNLKKGQGYWLNSYSSTPFRWGIGTDCEMPTEPLIKENINPLFIQSTNQAFYLIKEIEIDGKHPEEEDLILAYNNDILVGSAVYNPELTVLPVMGRDISEQTEGFLEDGEIPILKLLKNSGESIILNSTLEGFSNLLVSEIVSVTGSTIIIPTEWSIAPAYPNPFNPKTTIKIGVPVTLHAMSLRVFDINGRLIETLIDNKIEPGFHKVDWNANGLPSGIYLLKLKAEGYSDSQKLMLLK